jgi:exonuclease SbcD
VIVAHLSDLHLGFRAYGRLERGADMRERDVAAAFDRAVHQVIQLAPDVIVVSGDVFDRPDPPAGAVVALARGLEALRAALPDVPVLMVAGPRDTPRRPGDPGALAVLDSFPNVEAATGLTRSILIDRLDLHACLVPYRAVRRHAPALPDPDPRRRWNVLIMHAEAAKGASPDGLLVDPAEWDYVALGGEHRRMELAHRVQYPGALERVALDPWDEAADDKGFLTVDLASGRTEFHTVPGRPVVALAPVKVLPPEPERIRRRVREVVGEVPGGIADKIVRLRLQGASPSDLLALQGEPLLTLRGEALHLAIEAGQDLRVPFEAWRPVDAPLVVREAVLRELEDDGAVDPELRRMVEEAIPDNEGQAVELPHGALDAIDGALTGMGRVSTSVPLGLTAVLGGGGRARRAVAELYLKLGSTGPDGALRRWWMGMDSETLDGALRRAMEAVAESRGLGLVDGALERLGARAPELEGVPSERRERPVRGAVRVDAEQIEAELRNADRELIASRADASELDGDLEVATMDWHRERQDADTTLHAYRDRARELRARIRRMESAGPEAPCPTCGRVLEGHYDEVLQELREEWESVVQDGRWWKSRWEQLELKPLHLQELELRALTLHAALEAGSERVEVLRTRLRELRGGGRVFPLPAEGLEGRVVTALLRVRAARLARAAEVLLDRSSRFVSRISGARILALTRTEGVVSLQGSAGPLTPLSEEDLAAGRLALRLAAASLVAAGGRLVASLHLEEPFDRLDEEASIRTLTLTKELLQEIPRVILFSRGDAVEARPELFDYVLEVRDEGSTSAPVLRPAPAGPGRVALLRAAGGNPSLLEPR